MNGLEITKELKNDIEVNQIQLQNAIRNHQNLIVKLNGDSDEKYLKEIKEAEETIVRIGVEQKKLLERLREEYKAYQKSLRQNTIKSTIEERRCNLTNALNRARKQNFVPRARSSPVNSSSDDSDQRVSPQSSSKDYPVYPHDVSQAKFLSFFRLATHEVFKDMQNKRAERKRRSTANPQFVYGNKVWDYAGPPTKKKRNNFLTHPPSPPNTRGRKRQEQARSKSKSPPHSNTSPTNEKLTNGNQAHSSKSDIKAAFPSIPNLPSGLIIERVSPGRTSPDAKQCIMCKQPGALSICELCTNGFHISCHNRPFARTPKECPKCLMKDPRRSTNATHNTSSTSSLLRQTTAELTEKIQLKQQLQEKRQYLVAELTQLQNRHSELTISVKNQDAENEEIRLTHKATETKVNQIIKFIDTFKNFPVQETSNS